MSNDENPSLELQTLAAEVGHFIYYWGFKKVHGRIWTHIFLANHPLDAAALMKILNVSKALVSLSLNDLLEYNVIKTAGKTEKGTQAYKVNPQILDIIMGILQSREKRILNKVQKAFRNLQATDTEHLKAQDINLERLAMLGTMIDLAQGALEAILSLGSLDLSCWHTVADDLIKEISSK